MVREKIYRDFRVEKPDSNGSQYEKLFITVSFSAAQDRDGAVLRLDWFRDKREAESRWLSGHLEIEQKTASTFAKLLSKHISPMVNKMSELGLLNSENPLEVCQFIDKQKIPQIVWYSGEKLFLKDIRSNNMFAVRDLQYPSQRPYIIIADSVLDAKYKLKERMERYDNVASLDRFESRQLEMSEYEQLFQEGWRVACSPPKKKESE